MADVLQLAQDLTDIENNPDLFRKTIADLLLKIKELEDRIVELEEA